MTPGDYLAMWAAGTAFGGGVVVWWRVVGRGYTWLVGAVAALLALGAAAFEGGAAWLGVGVVIGAALAAGASRVAAGALAVGGGLLLVGRFSLAFITGALLLGAITSELLLGHWYLVDPRLPRWALSALALAAVGSAPLELALAGGYGGSLLGLVLIGTTALLMVGVSLALRLRGYRPVMAATGLSYLALLTGLGATGAVRLL